MEQAKLAVNSIGHTSGGRCGRGGCGPDGGLGGVRGVQPHVDQVRLVAEPEQPGMDS